MTSLDTVIVGAGQAGLGVSYFLKRAKRRHNVFEKGRVGETWLSQRWESFHLNTLNFMNGLPGLPYHGSEPDGFWSRDDQAAYLQQYVEHFRLPVQENVEVFSVEQNEGEEAFMVTTKAGGQVQEPVLTRSVVIASGVQHTPKIPPASAKIPGYITQLHSSEYHNAAGLPEGAVVVVGSGQSGCQIAEELLSVGRKVYLCTSKVGRVPRRYRGRDILEWWIEMKFLDVTLSSLADKSISRAAQPHISGLGRHGHTVSLQSLAQQGALILGRLQDVEGDTLVLGDDAAGNVRFADAFSERQKEMIDNHLAKTGLPLPPLESDPADFPDPEANCVSPLRRLEMGEAQVSTLIWATGFRMDFSWIHLPILDPQGNPIHQRGVSPLRGLYFVGFPWLNSRKSGILYGIEEDARYIAEAISDQLS